MAVGWKHKSDKKRMENMTSMELAKQERLEHERRQKAREFAIKQTNKRAEELFKQVPRVLIHLAPSEPTMNALLMTSGEDVERRIRQWEFECLAVIRLAKEDMRKSCFARKYAWNPDWKETGKLQMGRVLQQDDKPSPNKKEVASETV